MDSMSTKRVRNDYSDLINNFISQVSEINLLEKIRSVREEVRNLAPNKKNIGSGSRRSKLIREKLSLEIQELNKVFVLYFPEECSPSKRPRLDADATTRCQCPNMTLQVSSQQKQIVELETHIKMLKAKLNRRDKLLASKENVCLLKEKEKKAEIHALKTEIHKLTESLKAGNQQFNAEMQKSHAFRLQTENNMKIIEEERKKFAQQTKKHCQDLFNLNSVIRSNEKEIENLRAMVNVQKEKIALYENEASYFRNSVSHGQNNPNAYFFSAQMPCYSNHSQTQEESRKMQKDHLINQGLQEFYLKDYSKAVQTFTQTMQLSFHALMDANTLFNRARAYAHLGKFSKSVKDCTSLMHSVSVSCYLLQAYCKMQEMKIDEAFHDIKKLGNQYKYSKYFQEKAEWLKKLHGRILDYEDCFNVLGIERNATEAEIKKAYKDLALVHHPDKHTDSSKEVQQQQEELFKSIKTATDKLLNPQSETTYKSNQKIFEQGKNKFMKKLLDSCHVSEFSP